MDFVDDVLGSETQSGTADQAVVQESTGEQDSKPEQKSEAEKSEARIETRSPDDKADKQEPWTLSAVKDERRKRQELEARLRQSEAEKAALLSLQGGKKGEGEDDFEQRFYKEPVAFVRTAIAEGIKAAEDARFQRRVKVSESAARRRHKDFDDVVGEFVEAMRADPKLGDQARDSDDPAEFAYCFGKSLIEMRDVPSLPDYRAKVEAETRLKVEAELREKYGITDDVQASAAPARAVSLQHPSPGTSRGVGVKAQPVMSDDEWFDNVFVRRKKSG